MRTKTDYVLDIVAGAIIGLTIFVLIYTATHLYQLASAVEPTPNQYPVEAADWAVVSCDHTKSVRHRAPCGLVQNKQDVEIN